MKNLFLLISLLLPSFIFAQGTEATLLGQWSDDSLVPTSAFDGRYNEIWGLSVNGAEIAVIGSTRGTHFINVTDPNNPIEIEAAFVEGAATGAAIIHRDYHDYEGYLYAVADEGQSTLQIIDISDLPNTTTVVYDSKELIKRSHNIFIDETTGKLYACSVAIDGGNFDLRVLSLENPINPTVLSSFNNNFPDSNLSGVHDMYAENDVVYINGGTKGLYIYDFTDAVNPSLLGSISEYIQSGYNHSGWLDIKNHYYYMADETWGTDLKVVDVCDKANVEILTTIDPIVDWSDRIAHNLIVSCNILYVSYYYDGLMVFDISDPTNVERILYYDTYSAPNQAGYAGAWGVYPFLPSGNILISDMQNGLFIFEGVTEDCSAYTPNVCVDPVLANDELETSNININVFPQPAQSELFVNIKVKKDYTNLTLNLIDLMGRTIQTFESTTLNTGENHFSLKLKKSLCNGLFILKLSGDDLDISQKIIVQK